MTDNKGKHLELQNMEIVQKIEMDLNCLDHTTVALEDFNKLKSKLLKPSVLGLPQPHKINMFNNNATWCAIEAIHHH